MCDVCSAFSCKEKLYTEATKIHKCVETRHIFVLVSLLIVACGQSKLVCIIDLSLVVWVLQGLFKQKPKTGPRSVREQKFSELLSKQLWAWKVSPNFSSPSANRLFDSKCEKHWCVLKISWRHLSFCFGFFAPANWSLEERSVSPDEVPESTARGVFTQTQPLMLSFDFTLFIWNVRPHDDGWKIAAGYNWRSATYRQWTKDCFL